MKLKSNLGPLIAAAIIVFILFGNKIDINNLIPSLGGNSTKEEFPAQPTDQTVLTALQPVQQQLQNVNATDKLSLARLWREYAKLISLDNSVIMSTADIRKANNLSGKLMFVNEQFAEKYPSLINELNKATIQILGDKAVTLDTASRTKAIAWFNGLSWAATQ